MTTFDWMRPAWLWGFLPLSLLVIFWLRRGAAGRTWESFVDPELQPYVIEGDASNVRRMPLLLFAGWALALLLLAGPVWQQREIPVFEAVQAEVMVLDLSGSMLADDLAPNRITRARFKLQDLLQRNSGRQIALIAFAERPYVISPLTRDAGTVEAFLPSLDPTIMPAQGSRPDLAIDRAVQLLGQAQVKAGHILLLSDAQFSARDIDSAIAARKAGHRVSVLAVGTAAGAPLRDATGQFVQYADGSIVVPQLDISAMQDLADAGGGLAVKLSTSTEDLDALEALRQSLAISGSSEEAAAQEIYWIEYSPWLLWILVALVPFAFRRGVVA